MTLSCTVSELLSLTKSLTLPDIKRPRDTDHVRLGEIYHAYTSTLPCKSAHDIWSA